MHLLAADLEAASDGVAVDLGQTPGEIVLLSAAETDLACWAAAAHRLGGSPTLRLANLLQLSHPYSVDLYTDQVLSHAKLVIVRLLGGIGYWTYGMERLARLACPVVVLPGDGRDDPTLAAASTASPALRQHLLAAFTEGGVDNADQALRAAAASLGYPLTWGAPAPLPRAWALPRRGTGPLVPILVYRALIQAGDTAPLEALSEALAARGLTAAPLAVASLKDPAAIALLQEVAAERPALTIAATGFAVGDPAHPLAAPDGPVLQVAFAQDSPGSWQAGKRGLGPRDIAMHVALPEVDGRVFTRAIAFKADGVRCPLTQVVLRRLSPVPDRVEFVAELAQAWVRLGLLSVAERRVALVLANYPSRDGRIGNGVGLDVPESAAVILRAMAQAGYAIANAPTDGATLMAALLAGPSNQRRGAVGGELVSAADYHAGFQRLPKAVQAAMIERWGPPEADPGWVGDGFRVPALRFGAVTVMVQPARGYGVDPLRSAHDPDLVPPHGYLAAYLWVRAQADCVVHLGKHGTAEWLPGKSVGLSTTCWPEVVLGPTPQLYPFIVNDPGEGTQAKRRGAAVIIDHLTPPLTRAETYGPLKDLEQLVDEYHQATSLDARRRDWLAREITDRVARAGLGADCGIEPDDSLQQRLTKLDGFLCTVKELQIRDGLHVFGRSPTGSQATDLLVALTRIPRGQNASLLRALAADLGLALDPLTASLADPAPPVAPPLQPARLIGDVVEQLEEWAKRLVAGAPLPREWTRTATVLEEVRCHLAPALAACGPAELAALMDGLAGRFVPAGPSGAPTRGRSDVLPTGRNFHSVDPRALPTPAAWALGQRSAATLLERHAQSTGSDLTVAVLSLWGTAAMRTGGDDIAQALALIGVRPLWDAAAARVTGLEVIDLTALGRPRVDVSLRISGFFRDAFPALVDLFDRAVAMVAALAEPADQNPLAHAVREEQQRLEQAGLPPSLAAKGARRRIYGSKPGSYGAGLQALIDERAWTSRADLAAAVLAWGGYAYGSDGDGGMAEGVADPQGFRTRLARVQAVLHNQDNREHDLLDSDDYYQFEGGLTAAVAELSGTQPAVWHQDHSRPERPVTRSLQEELALVIRARAVNPKWIAGALRHGYKGAAEMAATVDYSFAFAATTGLVSDDQFQALFDAYLGDDAVRTQLAAVNRPALTEIAERFAEAIARGLWHPRANSVAATLDRVLEG